VVLTTGDVECWGDNFDGELGDGTTTDSFTPVSVALAGGAHATSLALGSDHSCARLTSGNVQCWGSNTYGQLGRDTSAETAPYGPNLVTLAATITNDGLVAGSQFTCAITGAGVQCWGLNNDGQLGVGDYSLHPLPTVVTSLNGATVTALAAGSDYACATTSTDVQCWGYNAYGQLGNGGFIRYNHPGHVQSSENFDTVAIDAGYQHTCVLSAQGMLRCWGLNDEGQFGIGTGGYSLTLTPAVALVGTDVSANSITAGADHTCAITSANDVQCWGSNSKGQIGDFSSDTFRPTPKRVAGGAFSAIALTAGHEHTCAVDKSDGTVKCWGGNYFGQLGDNSFADRSAPVSVLKADQSPLAADAVTAGAFHSCVIDKSGGVWCWGMNSLGQLGIGKGNAESEAVSVPLSGNTTAWGIAAGGYHTCIVHNTVQCWGYNPSGQVGVPGVQDKPVVVPLAGSNTLAQVVVAGVEHTCALTIAGAVQCWGSNGFGQLGQGDFATHDGPTPVGVLNNVTVTTLATSSTSKATCALTDQSEVWCWGSLYRFHINSTPAPLTTAAGIKVKATAVAVGYGHVCIVTLTGDTQCLGRNEYGQLGNGEHGAWPTVDAGANLALLSQSIKFTSYPGKPVVGGPQYQVMATATSKLTVNLTIDDSAAAVCSINNGFVSFLSTGTCTINAYQPGDATYNAATASQSFQVGTPQLVFTTQPINMPAGESTSVKVSIEDGAGNVLTNDNTTQVSIGIDFCGGTTLGTATVKQGVASFAVRVYTVAVGTTLQATSDPVAQTANSNFFHAITNVDMLFPGGFEACVP